jgi:hypothetical protein
VLLFRLPVENARSVLTFCAIIYSPNTCSILRHLKKSHFRWRSSLMLHLHNSPFSYPILLRNTSLPTTTATITALQSHDYPRLLTRISVVCFKIEVYQWNLLQRCILSDTNVRKNLMAVAGSTGRQLSSTQFSELL